MPTDIVPAMLSNGPQDGYTIAASGEYDASHMAWQAFDDNTTEWWADVEGPAWLSVTFPSPTVITDYGSTGV